MQRIEEYSKFLTESSQNNPLLICDIQPAYVDHIGFNLFEFIEYVETFDRIYWLYNGSDLGLDSEDDIINWLLELGIQEDTIDNINFFEKNYGYYRDQMEYCLNYEEVVDILKTMLKKNYEDSTELTDSDLTGISDEVISNLRKYPFSNNVELQEFLNRDNNYILVGGALAECVAEVKIDLEVLDLSYKLNNDFVF